MKQLGTVKPIVVVIQLWPAYLSVSLLYTAIKSILFHAPVAELAKYCKI